MQSKGRITRLDRSRLWKKHYALPSEHGAWSWWLGPFLVGIAAARLPGWDLLILLVAAFASFFLHQPAAIATRALAGRRPEKDLGLALPWVGAYALVAISTVAWLVLRGHTALLWLAALGVPFFAFHLGLTYRKAERRQMAVEMVGAGVMALWAPAAYWVGGGSDHLEPWILWALTWAQSMGAIANVYLRLEQRRWAAVPLRGERLRAGRRTLVHHLLGGLLSVAFAASGLAPWLTVAAFGAVLADAIDSILRPMVGVRPPQIGFRQLASTSLFVALMLVAYLAR
jgi:hypothetical protein